MIRSFKGKFSEALLNGVCPRGFPPDAVKTARRKLKMVHAAVALRDLEVPPGNRLEALKKGRKGQHSIRINDKSRICFRWAGQDAEDVEVTDYH